MANGSEIYDRLQEYYHLAGDQHFREILETLLTPDEGAIILELSAPLSPSELALKLNADATSLAARMDNLARRGLLYRGKEQYVAWGDAHQMKARVAFSAHENIPSKYIELRKKDMRYEESPYAEIHFWLKLYEMTGKPLIGSPTMNNDRVRSRILSNSSYFHCIERVATPPGTDLDRHRHIHRFDHSRNDTAGKDGIFHQHGAGTGFNDFSDWTAHINID